MCNMETFEGQYFLSERAVSQVLPAFDSERGRCVHHDEPLKFHSSGASKVAQGRHMGEDLLAVSNFSPCRGSLIELMAPKFPRNLRFSTQESLLESFDRKIATLVEKAKQLEDDPSFKENLERKLELPVLQQRQAEVNKFFCFLEITNLPRAVILDLTFLVVSNSHV